LRPYIDAFPEEHRKDAVTLQSHCDALVAKDIKDPALKALQGYIWKSGYASGALKCELFPDVEHALQKWHKAGVKIIIYSSGSVPAQKCELRNEDVLLSV